jgi:hypothetical protein
MERLFLLAKIERGLQQADAGELIPHEKVKERMAKWRVASGIIRLAANSTHPPQTVSSLL